MGIIVGGLLPAVLFGLIGVLQKLGAQTGMNVFVWVAAFGGAMLLFGCVGILMQDSIEWSSVGIACAAGAGFAYAVGSGALSFAIIHYQEPISKLIPIVNTSTLVAVLAGLIWLNEASKIDIRQLALGSALTIVGASFVVKA